MTTIAPRTTSIPATPAMRSLKTLLATLTIVSLAACQTVDLGPPDSQTAKSVDPDCTVNANDYKVLAYLQQSADAEKTARITNVLKKKYSANASGANPIDAAQAFVASHSDKTPAEISALVDNTCKN